MEITIVAFAQASERLGFRERRVACEPTDSAQDLLARLAPGCDLSQYRVAKDHEYCGWHEPLGAAKELAIIPPVSGG